MVIKKSDKAGKKLVAVFTKDNGRTKKTYFGSAGMDDYTKKKDLNTKDYTRAGYLSYYILWGESTSVRENISSYKKRFNLK